MKKKVINSNCGFMTRNRNETYSSNPDFFFLLSVLHIVADTFGAVSGFSCSYCEQFPQWTLLLHADSVSLQAFLCLLAQGFL